ncbi:hypothetical protein KUV50_13720 [Membranicola marinus]|uniref:Vitamin K epoxide reductase domain-containing protein n=1 Tax=Membranihabitans marinus TaxID=1227546 RepID=A0A953HYV8_9BACT|nr:vitamin K epoxide reductase family protein [Membranihabitans marinus]MBY5959206.1 hypothetical protein [Membranihabitans marinus]
METGFANLVYTFLDKNGYYYRHLDVELHSHPEFPALSALSDTFDKLHIPHLFTKLSPTHAEKLDGAFLAQLQMDELSEIYFIQKYKENIVITDQNNNKSSIPLTEFLQHWTGITILIKSRPPSYASILIKDSFTLFSLLFILLTYLITDSIGEIYFLLCSGIGLTLSILVLKVDLGKSSEVVNKLCGQRTKMDCNSIIHSKPSRLLKGNVKLTDLIIIYFAFILFFQIIFVNIISLGVLTLLSLPFVLYSLWHQFRLNQWCTLCLIIDLVLVIQFSLLLIYFNLTLPTLFILLEASVLGLLTILAWVMIKPFIVEWNHYKPILFDFLSIKKDWKLLHYYFVQSGALKLPECYQKFPLIQFKDGIWNLDLILQPNCPNCISALNRIISIQDKYQCFKQIRLMIKPENDHESNNWNSKISLLCKLDSTDAIQQWASYLKRSKSSQLDTKNIPNKIKENWMVALHNLSEWCNNTGLDKTPLILLNQKPLPYHYSPVDFAFWVDKSFEHFMTTREASP